MLARDRQLAEHEVDAAVTDALRAVDALDWVERLPQGLDTVLGHGRVHLTPAQAQQVALARLMVADPHTLVLDEATSLIDPRTARHLEGSMAALLADRTVIAIAHRSHAHDADRSLYYRRRTSSWAPPELSHGRVRPSGEPGAADLAALQGEDDLAGGRRSPTPVGLRPDRTGSGSWNRRLT